MKTLRWFGNGQWLRAFSLRGAWLALVISLAWTIPLSDVCADVLLTPTRDNYINRCSVSGSETNYGGADKLFVRSYHGSGCAVVEPKSARTIIQFDVSEPRIHISQITLRLYYYDYLGLQDPAGRTYQVRRLLNDWTEGTGTDPGIPGTTLDSSWENRHNDGTAKTSWDTHDLLHIDDGLGCSGWPYLGGGDLPYTDCNGTDHWGGDQVWATAVVPAAFGWMEWEVTGLALSWRYGAFANRGLIVMDSWEQWHSPYPSGGKWGSWFRSREFADADFWPQLVITEPWCPGDFDGDTLRNITDFTAFATAYPSQFGDPNYDPEADFDGDGFINVTDFTAFATYYGVPCP